MRPASALADHQDRRWAAPLIDAFGPLATDVEREFTERHRTRRRTEANAWLRDTHELVTRAPKWLRDSHNVGDVDDIAQWAAGACADKSTPALDEFLLRHQLPPVNAETDDGRLARSRDWQWWRRQIRRRVFRYRDQLHRHLGHIHRRRQVYCSDSAVEAQRERTRANRSMLGQLLAVSDVGDELGLLDIHDASTANPVNRRNEVMARLAGFERFADGRDDAALFTTLTCPARFHARYEDGRLNRRYNGATPREGNRYLCAVWARIRAALARQSITVYGFRIAEPHHDGTPHWHLLLWLPNRPRIHKAVLDTIRSRALADSPTEPGARKRRVKFEWIDRAKGSAVGYVAKYIAKAIDGAGIESDLFGNPAELAASRIVAWARTWGIRQFQQIGGASVTVWREYRRIQPVDGAWPLDPVTPHLAPWYAASLKGDWSAFLKQMGGAAPGRNQPTSLCRGVRASRITGECVPLVNRYGEPQEGSRRPITGLLRAGRELCTREKFWTVERIPAATGGAWTRVNNCTRGPPDG